MPRQFPLAIRTRWRADIGDNGTCGVFTLDDRLGFFRQVPRLRRDLKPSYDHTVVCLTPIKVRGEEQEKLIEVTAIPMDAWGYEILRDDPYKEAEHGRPAVSAAAEN